MQRRPQQQSPPLPTTIWLQYQVCIPSQLWSQAGLSDLILIEITILIKNLKNAVFPEPLYFESLQRRSGRVPGFIGACHYRFTD